MTQHMSVNTAASDATDPRAFLSSIGVEIDPATEDLLKTKLAAATNGQQAAAIVHFDS